MIQHKPTKLTDYDIRQFKMGPGEYAVVLDLPTGEMGFTIYKCGPKLWQIRDDLDDLIEYFSTVRECIGYLETLRRPK